MKLTETQARILNETDGRSIEEIAQALQMNPRTVKYYSDALRAKYGVKSRRALIPITYQEGETQ
jgi:DNA-binding CsgD family transcriptional regulator